MTAWGVARPFPLEPLLEATGLPLTAFRREVQASSGTVRIVAERGLTVEQADRWAIGLGVHPGEVWPDWWGDVGGDGPANSCMGRSRG